LQFWHFQALFVGNNSYFACPQGIFVKDLDGTNSFGDFQQFLAKIMTFRDLLSGGHHDA
jgi:hypothetical protein